MVPGTVHKKPLWSVLVPGLIVYFSFLPMTAAGLNKELESIQPLAASGRYFHALDALAHLESVYPGSSRLKLEQALVYIQLEQFDQALALLSLVLEDPTLPDAVRVQVQLLYLSARRKQTALHTAHWRGRAQISYLSGLDLGQAKARLSYSRSDRVMTFNAQGYPWHLNRLMSISTHYVQDSERNEALFDLDLSGGLRQSVRAVTMDSQVGMVLSPSEPGVYIQIGLFYDVSPALQLAYRLKCQWIDSDFDSWQHRVSAAWLGESSWQPTIAFGFEDNSKSEYDRHFWQASATRKDAIPITVRLAQTNTARTSTTEANLTADFNLARHWILVPELGYWYTDSWQGWRLALGVEWKP